MESAVIERVKTEDLEQTKSLFTTNGDYEQTRQATTALLFVEEDEDFVRPTRHALDLTLKMLESANAELVGRGIKFPYGSSSTSESGGICLFWEKNGQSVQLEVPPKNGGMLYVHVISLNESLMNKEVTAKTLADALTDFSLSSGQRPGAKNAPVSAAAR